jgi:dTDP-4-dehydrorhamnose reductase
VKTAVARYLVLGCTGQLGTALLRELGARGVAVVAPPEAELDLLHADIEAVVGAASPTVVINASAYNDVDGAEQASNRTAAFGLNRDVPAGLARTCAARGIPLVHVSTDYVFDGRSHEPYGENDPTAPLQAYGRSKLEGERAVAAAHPGALVVRTSTLFGTDRRGGSNYVAAVLARARAVSALDVVRLPVSSPTYASDLGRGILRLLDAGASGLVHVVNAGGCSRLELATEAVRLAGLAGRVEIRERPAATTGAARPAYSVLDTARYTALTGDAMRPWQEAVRDYVEARA